MRILALSSGSRHGELRVLAPLNVISEVQRLAAHLARADFVTQIISAQCFMFKHPVQKRAWRHIRFGNRRIRPEEAGESFRFGQSDCRVSSVHVFSD